MTWQRYNKNLRKSALLAEYYSSWTNLGTSAKVVYEPEHRVPAPNRHGGKLLPIHRGIAAYGCPLWNQGHRQSQEFSVQIHRRPCQVDQNGTTIQTQHLLQQTIQHNLGARID